MPTFRAMPSRLALFGAEGIGLCRTEHMFFAEDRIGHMRTMILANNEKDRRDALKKLLPMQRADFVGLFKAMEVAAGNHPPARSAAARVPAQAGRTARSKSSTSKTPSPARPS